MCLCLLWMCCTTPTILNCICGLFDFLLGCAAIHCGKDYGFLYDALVLLLMLVFIAKPPIAFQLSFQMDSSIIKAMNEKPLMYPLNCDVCIKHNVAARDDPSHHRILTLNFHHWTCFQIKTELSVRSATHYSAFIFNTHSMLMNFPLPRIRTKSSVHRS